MRILIVATEFPPGPGGIGRHASALAHGLSARGCEVVVAAPQPYATDDAVTAFNERVPFTVTPLRQKRGRIVTNLHRYREVRRLVADGPDILVASGLRAVLFAGSTRSPAPWVAVMHGSELARPSAPLRPLLRRALERADSVVCVSRYTRSLLHKIAARVRRDVVIPNGADDRLFRPLSSSERKSFRRRYGLDDAPVVLTVGNVTERKGQDLIVAALPRLIESVPDVRYVMAGLPTQRAEIEQLASSLGVKEHICFTGVLEDADLVRAYNACDVFALTSRDADGDVEGYGIAVVEAALCGRPSVVTPGSGLQEAVSHGESGVVTDDLGSDAIARALGNLLADPARRARLGDMARARALTQQTWARALERYAILFTELVDEIGSAAAVRRSNPGG